MTSGENDWLYLAGGAAFTGQFVVAIVAAGITRGQYGPFRVQYPFFWMLECITLAAERRNQELETTVRHFDAYQSQTDREPGAHFEERPTDSGEQSSSVTMQIPARGAPRVEAGESVERDAEREPIKSPGVTTAQLVSLVRGLGILAAVLTAVALFVFLLGVGGESWMWGLIGVAASMVIAIVVTRVDRRRGSK